MLANIGRASAPAMLQPRQRLAWAFLSQAREIVPCYKAFDHMSGFGFGLLTDSWDLCDQGGAVYARGDSGHDYAVAASAFGSVEGLVGGFD